MLEFKFLLKFKRDFDEICVKNLFKFRNFVEFKARNFTKFQAINFAEFKSLNLPSEVRNG